MRVLAVDPRRGHVETDGVRLVSYGDVLRWADAVAMMCPAGRDREPILGPAEIAQMRPGAVLVNASRARLVDTEAVTAAIRVGRLRGYAVDDVVFDPQKYADLLAEGRIVQTGHSAWWSDEALERGGAMWAERIRCLVLGSPIDVVSTASVGSGGHLLDHTEASAC